LILAQNERWRRLTQCTSSARCSNTRWRGRHGCRNTRGKSAADGNNRRKAG